MKLIEYLEKRNGIGMNGVIQALSKGESKILGVDITKKGWSKTDVDFSQDLINKCVLHVLKSDWLKTSIRNRVSKMFCDDNFKTDLQKLYLFRSDSGLYKIGISKHPFKRASNLSTSSGFKIQVIGIWEMLSARKQEQELHKIFFKNRAEGEWFSVTLSPEIIEKNITQEFKIIFTQPS